MAKIKDETTRRRLGRGLGSLLATSPAVAVEVPTESPPARSAANAGLVQEKPLLPAHLQPTDGIALIELKRIRPNPMQPRTGFDEAGLDSLAASIRAAGVMQPIIVRPNRAAAGEYEIVAGERRWRAAHRVGLATIPAVIRDLDDHTAAEWALVENLQREDLDAIEQAEAFSTLIRQFHLTHQDVADRVGLDRSTVSNSLRLLELDENCRRAVRSGRLSAGHARALLSVASQSDRQRLSKAAIQAGWSVRELENRCRAVGQAAGQTALPTISKPSNAHLEDLQRRLGEHLGTRVTIQPGRKKGAGVITIHFYDLDQFDGLMQKFGFDGAS